MARRVSSISNGDKWGEDPSVRAMRQVFQRMEVAQKELLGGLGISPFNPNLRGWRECARAGILSVEFHRLWVSG